MSIKIMTRVFDSDLPTTEKMVLLAMADYASDNGDSIFPSIETLSRKTSLSERAVQNTIKSLIEKNYLILLKKGGGRNKTNLYKIRCSRFTVYEDNFELKGAPDTRKGEPGAQKGAGGAPDPSLNIIKDTGAENAPLQEPTYENCNDDGEPTTKKKKSKSNGYYKIASAMAQVTGTSLESNKEQIYREAKLISRDARVTPEEIISQFAPGGDWYRYDWRGQKGQRPTIAQIRQTIFTFSEPIPNRRSAKNIGMDAVKAELARLEQEDVSR